MSYEMSKDMSEFGTPKPQERSLAQDPEHALGPVVINPRRTLFIPQPRDRGSDMSEEIAKAIQYATPLQLFENAAETRSPDSFGEYAGSRKHLSTVQAASIAEFRELLLRTRDALESQMPDEAIDDEVRHETSHASAAATLGAMATTYELAFFRVFGPDITEEGEICTESNSQHHFSGAIPRLHAAAVQAYPLVPSPGDIADIRGLGYGGIADVAERAMSYNTVHGFTIPVPLSYVV